MNEPRKMALVLLIIMAFGIVALIFEWLSEVIGRMWLWLIAVSFALLILALTIHYSHARDLDGRYAQSPLKEWFDSLKSGKGPCCSDADGNVVKDADWQSSGGRYRVFIEGEWVVVDDDAVITEPNRFGRTMVWPMHKDGKPVVRCFMPGPMI